MVDQRLPSRPGSWSYGFVDVPPGATNLTLSATNTYRHRPIRRCELFVKFGAEPTTNSFDATRWLTMPGPARTVGFISIGPPLTSGRYFVGIFNPSPTAAEQVFIFATVGLPFVPAQTIYSSTDTPIPMLDDAVTNDSIIVPDNQIISSLDVRIARAASAHFGFGVPPDQSRRHARFADGKPRRHSTPMAWAQHSQQVTLWPKPSPAARLRPPPTSFITGHHQRDAEHQLQFLHLAG